MLFLGSQLLPIATAGMAFLGALIGVPLSIRWASSMGMLDQPDARKIHRIPVPRLGGVGIFGGVLIGLLAASVAGFSIANDLTGDAWPQFSAILAGGSFVFVVGLVDDIRGVSSRFKLVALITAAAMICGGGVVLGDLVFGGQSMVEFRLVSWLMTIVFVMTIAVAMNFIDGLDGLAAGLSLLAAVTLAALSLMAGSLTAAIIPLAVSGALIAFLLFNWHPARTFMGDGGSLTLGFLLAAAMVLANGEIGTMRGLIIPSLALSVPLTDTVLTVFRRHYQQRRSVFSAERGHIHHRLLDRGFSHTQAVGFMLVVSGLAVGIGLISFGFEGYATLGGLSLVLPLLYGAFRFAGSVRTTEMVEALKSKRRSDRDKRRYRSTFEDLQLEFAHVNTFSGWWRSACGAAERLDFARLHVRVPGEDGRMRDMRWENAKTDLQVAPMMRAMIPIAFGTTSDPTAMAAVDIATGGSLESSSERLGLFSRLMTEYSLANLRARQRQLALERRGRDTPGAMPGDDVPRRGGLPDASGSPLGHLKVALVHDFFYTYAGAERVVEEILQVVPQADVFSLFDFLPDDEREFLHQKPVTTTFIQKLPWASTKHRGYLPLMPLAIEQLDLSGYDLVISSSYVAAKGVITGPDQLHICYCHSPVRYAWDLQHQYLRQAGLGFSAKGIFARALLHYIRNWDVRSSLGVDHFIANSEFVGRRIKKLYRRNATVIHPPVQTDRFTPSKPPKLEGVNRIATDRNVVGGAGDWPIDPPTRPVRGNDGTYLVLGRMVPYKRTDLIVAAFAKMPHRRLTIIGEGPDFEKCRAIGTPNVRFLGRLPQTDVVEHLRSAKALVFAAEEDFGIVPVEAMACGTPVIAFGKGGVTESVTDGVHGVHYDEQSESSLIDAVQRFEAAVEFDKFDRDRIRRHAEKFSTAAFADHLQNHLIRWCAARWPDRFTASGLAVAATPPPRAEATDQPAVQTSPKPSVEHIEA